MAEGSVLYSIVENAIHHATSKISLQNKHYFTKCTWKRLANLQFIWISSFSKHFRKLTFNNIHFHRTFKTKIIISTNKYVTIHNDLFSDFEREIAGNDTCFCKRFRFYLGTTCVRHICIHPPIALNLSFYKTPSRMSYEAVGCTIFKIFSKS